MSDSERTPQRTARVNSERFDTELAAVWYAANCFYETSYRGDREYIGVVFREPNWKFGLTVRGDGAHPESKARIGDGAGLVQAGAESHAPARRRPLGLRASKGSAGSRTRARRIL